MPHIIGTAGHIDHGKTALIRALTGQDTDRLKEEKERGISIDLGFAYLDLASGERVGIVDVPGHERFIRNMLAGAHGIDLVLLVVAADDGIMPQTEEHLDILHLLGTAHAVVAITKADLVDGARLASVREDIEILLAGTTLEGAPLVPVSSVTGEGVQELRQVIERQLAGYVREPSSGYFRLPVDRAFIMHGHGVVVTGTAVGGAVHIGDTVRVLPGGEETRVRGVQVHGHEVTEATHGQRVALNLAGVERSEVVRGHVVCDPRLDRVTERFDAWIEVRPAAGRALESHQPVRLFVGTAEVLGKVVLLEGRTALPPRQRGYAQLVLRAPVQVLRGDRFVLRNQSSQRTIGGGMVVHPFARRHARGDAASAALESLRTAPTAARVVNALMQLEPELAVAPEFLAQAANLELAVVYEALRHDASIRCLPDSIAPVACTTAAKWNALRDAVVAALRAFHQQQPLVPGVEMEPLRMQVAPDLSAKLYRTLLDGLLAENIIARADASSVRLPSHQVTLRRDEEALGARAQGLIAAGGVTPPDLKQIESALGVPRQRLQPILQQLERQGTVVRVATDLYFGRDAVERARAVLRQYAEAHGEINAATFRDLLGASRKFSISLLDYFDRTGFTLRVGDSRKLRSAR